MRLNTLGPMGTSQTEINNATDTVYTSVGRDRATCYVNCGPNGWPPTIFKFFVISTMASSKSQSVLWRHQKPSSVLWRHQKSIKYFVTVLAPSARVMEHKTLCVSVEIQFAFRTLATLFVVLDFSLRWHLSGRRRGGFHGRRCQLCSFALVLCILQVHGAMTQ